MRLVLNIVFLAIYHAAGYCTDSVGSILCEWGNSRRYSGEHPEPVSNQLFIDALQAFTIDVYSPVHLVVYLQVSAGADLSRLCTT